LPATRTPAQRVYVHRERRRTTETRRAMVWAPQPPAPPAAAWAEECPPPTRWVRPRAVGRGCPQGGRSRRLLATRRQLGCRRDGIRAIPARDATERVARRKPPACGYPRRRPPCPRSRRLCRVPRDSADDRRQVGLRRSKLLQR